MIKNKFFSLAKMIIVIALMIYSLYVVLSRLSELTLFNVLLAIAVVIGCFTVSVGLIKNRNTKILLKAKNTVMLLNGLCWLCLILLVISSITDLLTWSKQVHAFLFISAALLFAVSTTIKFFQRKRLRGRAK